MSRRSSAASRSSTRSSTRLDGLVGKLIDLSKIESRRDVFERRPVAVAAIVDDALAMFRTMDLATDIAVDVQMERRPARPSATARRWCRPSATC